MTTKPEQKKLPEIYYKAVRFTPGFNMMLGQSHSTQLGHVQCSTKERPSKYSARWIVGSPMLFIQWAGDNGKLLEYDIPLSVVMGCTRIPEGDAPAPLSR